MTLPLEDEIRFDKSMTVALFIVSTLAAGLVPPYFLAPVLHVPPEIVAGASAITFTELLWRDRVRPRLRWNSAGVQLVRAARRLSIRWFEIDQVHIDFNQIRSQCGYECLVWEFDANVVASHFSRSYRERNSRRVNSLLTARLAAEATVDNLPQDLPRRPLMLYVLSMAAAICESIALL